ncbi:NAD(P)-dependent oxidoreductase [Occultella gossypii]|uniref:Phosphoglycerate dehydrogenase n=1 Tax=Occultella gossypii TaxID=2800820 RepID=A0ABS7SGR6_9MICO|nr:NAD(P)-dependent oxidoreductase [Occultella gossypii]MBZ2199108.1 phosphoglycerate dehydrogenase [Occultella gossypii]
MKLLLPNSIPMSVTAPVGVTTAVYDVAAPIPAEHRDAEAIVVWGSSGERIAAMVTELPRLRWIQALMAGTDSVAAAGFDDSVVLTSGGGLHDAPVAEHTLALILAAARRLDTAVRAGDAHEWYKSLDVNQAFGTTGTFTTLFGAKVVIWGFGGIGTRLAGFLTALGAQVTGVATTAGERAGYRVITPADLPGELADTDVLVDILPALPTTQKVVDAAILGALPEHAWFVNVGRGATVDEAALRQALVEGSIGGAALDVFATEPLPADDPLWGSSNLIVTPHSAGGRPQDPEQRIEENLRRFLAGEELLYTV